MKIIVISGTPGTGKTSVSKAIGESYKSKIISLNEFAIKVNFNIKYDTKRKTHIIDTEKLLPHLVDLIEHNKKKKS